MASVTTYTCDRCGKEGSHWEINGTISVQHPITKPSDNHISIFLELCESCTAEVYTFIKSFMKKE